MGIGEQETIQIIHIWQDFVLRKKCSIWFERDIISAGISPISHSRTRRGRHPGVPGSNEGDSNPKTCGEGLLHT